MKTWQFRLEVDMGNAAFEEPEGELMVILHKLSLEILEIPSVLDEAVDRHNVVLDSNGNTVGWWTITEVEE